jgi:formylglycine-generating enzyme required for sulfatase activity
VKPGNILIGTDGYPYLLDFGLALREEDATVNSHQAGTPAYMSPEQASGEGHRVSARSDLYSLGAVLFRILVGHPPLAEKHLETSADPDAVVSLRRYDKKIPKELERICQRALARRATQRYASAREMAEDLEWFVASQQGVASGQPNQAVRWDSQRSSPLSGSRTPPSDGAFDSRNLASRAPVGMTKIVPKGLRAFDSDDADFFLELLPGPRDRDGLPESIRLWKSRVESTDPKKTCSVGLIFGPSGCGKTSLLKAGLLPRLADHVIPIYIEATPDQTESQLLNNLRRQCPELDPQLSLKESLAALRLGRGMSLDKKLLIVVDQFEQWLHANSKHQEDCPLVQALRQCDGIHLQTLLLVRDDFWMAATRFFQALEIRLREDRNLAAVDLFSQHHAQKVLCEFGRAFGVFPDDLNAITKEQRAFLKQAVSDLAESEKVICVRLTLFAEMMKEKSWTPATLKKVGGAKGLGAAFLEDMFGTTAQAPRYTNHQKAARAVLESLLPEPGSPMRGKQRSYDELLEISGYRNRTDEFDDLIQILDSELRLITPTEPKSNEPSEASVKAAQQDTKYYQLAHDYLVRSLRDWLTHNQMGTRRGRAERLLKDLASVWNTWPDNRVLPSLLQWLQIGLLTESEKWTPPQKNLMSKAAWYHLRRATIVAGLLIAVVFSGVKIRDELVRRQSRNHAYGLVDSLFSADIAQVPSIIAQMQGYRRWTDPLIRRVQQTAPDQSREKLYASVALVRSDPSLADYLFDRLVSASDPREMLVIRRALLPFRQDLTNRLWQVVASSEKADPSRRLHAAAALVVFDPNSPRWEQHGETVAEALVLENPIYLGRWIDIFRPVTASLMEPLRQIFRDQNPDRSSENAIATTILVDLTAHQPELLTELLLDASEKQFELVCEKLQGHPGDGVPILLDYIERPWSKISLNWTLQFYQWEGQEAFAPPQDWDQIIASPIVDQIETCDLDLWAVSGSVPPPTANVPSEYFAGSASSDVSLGEDEYELSITFDDGVRIWLDDRLLFENWSANSPITETIPLRDCAGVHTIRIDYFQIRGGYVLSADLQRSESFKETLAKRQANAAIALLKLDQPATMWSLLKQDRDPRRRSYLIDRLGARKIDPFLILNRLEREIDPAVRQALLLSLGEKPVSEIEEPSAKPWLDKLRHQYLHDPDPGIHAATQWLLLAWGQQAWLEQVRSEKAAETEWRRQKLTKIRQSLGKDDQPKSPAWYINSQGQTMIVIPGPQEFQMGSPWTEPDRVPFQEIRHPKRIPRSFAVSATPVTVKQYQRSVVDKDGLDPAADGGDIPVTDIDWYACAVYCNWLSEQEELPTEQWCYEISDEGIRLRPNYLELEGYRLATEAEIEFITRAGASTSRCYGESDELLEKYAWYIRNSEERLHPVGRLKPNDLGFFDVHGNVWTWCQESYQDYPRIAEVSDDREDELIVSPTDRRVIRGGSFLKQASNVRSALRGGVAPTLLFNDIGFRVARTFRVTSAKSPAELAAKVEASNQPSSQE